GTISGSTTSQTVTVVANAPCNGSYTLTLVITKNSGSTTCAQTFVINVPDFTLPANESSTVNCAANAVQPTPPTVTDACVKTLTQKTTTPSTVTCNGTMAYSFAYTDCAAHTHTWTYTYTIAVPDFTLPANGSSTVNCPANAVQPAAPTVVDACGNTLTPSA